MARLFSPQYRLVFGQPWPVWAAALLVAMVNVFLFAFDRPWTASDGMRNWGDWVLTGVGVVRRPDLIVPWLYSGSLLNLGVLFGGLAAALLSREFAVRVPPRGELVKGGLGGLAMGAGAMLALGCNIGGFFSATSALSLSGFGMMLGLGVGAFLAIRYLMWEVAHRPTWSMGRGSVLAAARREKSRQPVVGVVILAALVLLPFLYALAGSFTRLGLTAAGLAGKLGAAVFLPSAFGWGGAVVLVIVVMAAWAAAATWNEASGRFSALQ